MRLLLIRHAQTTWNAAGRVQGQADPPLSEEGRAQCEALAGRLAGRRIDALYSSDLERARLTAGAVAWATGATMVLEPGLREVGLGRWEGATPDTLRRDDPEGFARWSREASWDAVPGGEGNTAFRARVLGVMGRLAAGRGEAQIVAAVTHIGVIRLVLSLCAGLESRGLRWPWAIDNTALTLLDAPADVAAWNTPALRVLAVNDAAHLHTAAGPG